MDRLASNLTIAFNPAQQFYTCTILLVGIFMLLLIDVMTQFAQSTASDNTADRIVTAAAFPSVANTLDLARDAATPIK